MADEKINERKYESLPEQLKKAYAAGTEARKGLKAFAGNAKLFAGWTVGVLLLIGMVIFYIPYLKEKPRVATGDAFERSTSLHQQPKQQQMAEATWKKSTDGALPVGVWSEEMKILPGCTVHFDAGNGTAYAVEYKLYGSGWKQHSPGSAINGDTVRFILHKERVAQVPVRITC